MAASTNMLGEEVKKITKCPICKDTLCNPMMLPCFHIFCLKCIERYGKDKRPGEALPCPMCRKKFKIPTGGLSMPSTNFFLDRSITDQCRSTATTEVDCDVCTKVGTKGKVVASSICMECRQSLCDKCCSMHKQVRGTMDHTLFPVCEVSEEVRKKLDASFCKKHPTDELKFHCQVCKIPVCATCSITNHKSHETCEIADRAEALKKDFLKYSDDVDVFRLNIKEHLGRANEQVESFLRTIEQVEKEVKERSKNIKLMVDRQTDDLLRELNSHKNSILKNIKLGSEGLEMNMLICDNFKQFCTKVVTEADSVEVVRVADELKTRAENVKLLSVPEIKTLPQIKFVPSVLPTKTDQDNIVGTLSCKYELKLIQTC